jgi:hypothetical protein
MRPSFGVRKLMINEPPCLRLYGNKAEACLSCQGHDKQSISVLDAEASVSRCRIRTLHAGNPLECASHACAFMVTKLKHGFSNP